MSLEEVFRAEHGRVVAALARRFGDLDLAEDATGDALLVAAERWPTEGMPPNPGGWLTTVAGNKALDRLRRERRGREKYAGGGTDGRADGRATATHRAPGPGPSRTTDSGSCSPAATRPWLRRTGSR